MTLADLLSHGESLWTTFKDAPDMKVVADSVIALILGLFFGYERSYRGRAAGLRTYGIVCLVSAALTSASLHLGKDAGEVLLPGGRFIDPTRTIQGIVTGIGFLGAGIIMKDGVKISGLTTSASIWAAAAIGILVGSGYAIGACIITAIAEGFMLLGSRFDTLLPSRRPVLVSLQFKKGTKISADAVRELVRENGYEISGNSIAVESRAGQIMWSFVGTALNRRHPLAVTDLADAFSGIDGLETFHISRARN